MHESIVYLPTEADAPFAVQMAGISYCDGHYRIQRSRSPITVMEYVRRGQGEIIEENQRFHPGPGDVYLLHQGRSHTYYADPCDPWEKIWFNVRGPVVTSLLAAYGLDQVNLLPSCPNQLEKDFLDFLQAMKAERPLEARFDEGALIFQRILQKLVKQGPEGTPQEKEVAQLRDHIHQNLHRPLSLDELATLIFRSKAYTIQLFQRHYHTTPYAYLTQCRLEAACRLLTETRLPIKSIAAKLSFADQHYFSNVFKKHWGLSPREYRRQGS